MAKLGRPRGSKNRKTLMRELEAKELAKIVDVSKSHLVERLPSVVMVVVEQALDGCRASQKLILDRAIPAKKQVDRDETSETLITINIGEATNGKPQQSFNEWSSTYSTADVSADDESDGEPGEGRESYPSEQQH